MASPAATPFPPLPRSFYDRPVVEVALALLGQLLLRRVEGEVAGGRIVEVEAYLASGDPACHAARGRTRKNAAMFGPPGRAYVYPIHSRHCFNVVTEAEGSPSAVLVRALEPRWGLEGMLRRRGSPPLRDLARGPARLCEALAIDRRLDGSDLVAGEELWLAAGEAAPASGMVRRTVRIGVTSAQDLPLRFYLAECPFVSGPRRPPAAGPTALPKPAPGAARRKVDRRQA